MLWDVGGLGFSVLTQLVVPAAVFPGAPGRIQGDQQHAGGAEELLLQQLDDAAVPTATAALHAAQLHPVPEVRGHPAPPPRARPHLNPFSSACRVSEAVRIAGSLLFILLLFILTAALVKVPMDEDRFFSVTMATIWFINCEWAWPGRDPC